MTNTRILFNRHPEAMSVAHALEGRRVGDGWLCHCPLPGHGRKRGDLNPSLKVTDGPDCLLVYCHAGCDSRDVLAALRQRGLTEVDRQTVQHRAKPANDNEKALAAWNSGVSSDNSPVSLYLRRRGILISIPASIRYIADPAMPAMIVAVQNLIGEIQAVQFTYLTPDGCKADVPVPRRTIGSLVDGAVRLAEASDTLGLSEGVEDALAAIQLTQIPCWASLGAGRMHQVPVPDKIRELQIFLDNDDVGRAAAERTATYHNSQGRVVRLRFPPPDHKDWASLVESQINRRVA